MDTKPLEIESESYIQYELIKHGFKVTKPTFDKEGADLLIVENITEKYTKFLKIQCKGRTIKNNGSRIDIPKSYVKENFVVFLYVVDEQKESMLFVFFYEDIIKWGIHSDKYVFNFTFLKLKESDFIIHKFSHDKASALRKKLLNSEIKKYTTLLADEIYLNKAIDKTIKTYKEIYPEIHFIRPEINEVIKNILLFYDNFKSDEKKISCYVFSYDESGDDSVKSSLFSLENGYKGKIYTEVTDEFISFEMMKHLERVINSENVILVSNDMIFESELNSLQEKGIQVTLVLYSTDDGRDIFTHNKWGDIMFPIAQAMGLNEYQW